MQGLVTIGTATGPAELEVAAALCAAAREGGSRPAAFVASAVGGVARAAIDRLAEASETSHPALTARAYEVAAPPLIAARHAGAELLPEPLQDAARAAAADGDLLVVATSGGLMAPLAERYSNRDLALELGLPVVLSVAAGPDMLAPALLALEGLAGAGLAIPALVISGWPETPGRVLLDELKLIERLATTDVHTLDGDRDAAPSWPVAEWARATAAAPATLAAGEAPAPARVTLEPYTAWEEHPVGDPRATPRASIMGTMLEIVGVEGPMTASRAYSLYNRASGGRKLTSVARAPLSSSVYWLAQERRVVLVRKDDIPWQDDDVVRMPDSPAVRVRELGPRALEEVPLDEIAELVRRLRAARGGQDATSLKRAVLGVYGLKRLTTRADEYLGLALDLAEGGSTGE
jgi:dethiobiotin synthetase